MDIQIRALDTFMHGYHRGRLDAEAGKTYVMPQAEADELVKRGIAEIVTDDPAPQTSVTDDPAPQTSVTDSQSAEAAAAEAAAGDSVDDLIGGEKAESDPENKADKSAKNKAK